MNFIKSIILAVVNAVEIAFDFIFTPFINLTSKDEQTRERAAFSVFLRLLVLCGYIFGWSGIVIGVASTLLSISLWITMLQMIIQTINILAIGLAGGNPSKAVAPVDGF